MGLGLYLLNPDRMMELLFFDSCIVVAGSFFAGNFYEITNVASKKGNIKW